MGGSFCTPGMIHLHQWVDRFAKLGLRRRQSLVDRFPHLHAPYREPPQTWRGLSRVDRRATGVQAPSTPSQERRRAVEVVGEPSTDRPAVKTRPRGDIRKGGPANTFCVHASNDRQHDQPFGWVVGSLGGQELVQCVENRRGTHDRPGSSYFEACLDLPGQVLKMLASDSCSAFSTTSARCQAS